jgi:hypothetical protein
MRLIRQSQSDRVMRLVEGLPSRMNWTKEDDDRIREMAAKGAAVGPEEDYSAENEATGRQGLVCSREPT